MNKMNLKETKLKFPNDYDLGEYLRGNHAEIEDLSVSEAQKLLKEYPNNYLLGSHVRHHYKK